MSTKDMIKLAYDVLKEANRLDLAEEIVELRNDNLDLKEETFKLREELAAAKVQLKLKSQIVFEEGIYWIKNDELTKNGLDTPVCPNCYTKEEKIFRLVFQPWNNGKAVRCHNCQFFREFQ